jgi:hypothetical protein
VSRANLGAQRPVADHLAVGVDTDGRKEVLGPAGSRRLDRNSLVPVTPALPDGTAPGCGCSVRVLRRVANRVANAHARRWTCVHADARAQAFVRHQRTAMDRSDAHGMQGVRGSSPLSSTNAQVRRLINDL